MGKMSSKWQSRVQALVPLTEQEESVKELLEGLHVQCQAHTVFPYRNRSMVVDFFLPGPNLVVECWRSESRRGSALMWVEKNAAYVDLKFARLKDEVEVVCEPKVMPWGNHTAQFRDPEGTLILMYTPVTEAAKKRFGGR